VQRWVAKLDRFCLLWALSKTTLCPSRIWLPLPQPTLRGLSPWPYVGEILQGGWDSPPIQSAYLRRAVHYACADHGCVRRTQEFRANRRDAAAAVRCLACPDCLLPSLPGVSPLALDFRSDRAIPCVDLA